MPVAEAEESLRFIRELMERSTRHSTFSGLSGILAGTYSIAGCVAQRFVLPTLWPTRPVAAFTALWAIVAALTIGTDFLLTKRKAATVGKTIYSRLGRQLIGAAAPGLLTGGLITLTFMRYSPNLLAPSGFIFPFWMLAYGTAVCAVGIFSQKEVSRLGWAFVGAGLITLLVNLAPLAWGWGWATDFTLAMMAVSFGGFHIAYGIAVSGKSGW